jgi:hypothetical protein
MRTKFTAVALAVLCVALATQLTRPAWGQFLPVTGGPVFVKPSCVATVEGAFCAINGQTATVPRQTALLVSKCTDTSCYPH